MSMSDMMRFRGVGGSARIPFTNRLLEVLFEIVKKK
jgi:hypothetical protein